MKKLLLIIICSMLFSNATASAADSGWYWLSSNAKYSKYFEPDSVTVVKQAADRSGKTVATEITARIKTAFTKQGAVETLKNYDISSIKSDDLSYSIAVVSIFPQTRTLQYRQEDFFNFAGEVIWSKNAGRIKEINSQAFDEVFYCAVCDEVFRQGELEMINSPARWLNLWTFTDDGVSISVLADCSTFQLKSNNLIFWTWTEFKADNKVTEIRFIKNAVNLVQGTARVITGEVWSAANRRWSVFDDDYGGAYRLIKSDEPDYIGLVRLRAFAQNQRSWVVRYSL